MRIKKQKKNQMFVTRTHFDKSLNDLTRVILRGFDLTAKDTAEFRAEVKAEIQRIDLRLGQVAYRFEIQDVERRLGRIEHKIGLTDR